MIWLVFLSAAGFFWPAAAHYLYSNVAFNLSASLGMIAIILSPLSRTSRSDFRQDFDKAYRRFYRGDVRTEMEEEERSRLSKLNPKQQKQVESAVRVASNLYLHTIPGAEERARQFAVQSAGFAVPLLDLLFECRAEGVRTDNGQGRVRCGI